MRPIRLQRWWDGVPVTILTPGVQRVDGTNTISDRFGDADLVWDPGFKLEPRPGILHCVIHKRDKRVCTIETGCRCGSYDITVVKTIHHFIRRPDAMVELAVKLGASTIYCAVIDKLDTALVKLVRKAGIRLLAPEENGTVKKEIDLGTQYNTNDDHLTSSGGYQNVE